MYGNNVHTDMSNPFWNLLWQSRMGCACLYVMKFCFGKTEKWMNCNYVKYLIKTMCIIRVAQFSKNLEFFSNILSRLLEWQYFKFVLSNSLYLLSFVGGVFSPLVPVMKNWSFFGHVSTLFVIFVATLMYILISIFFEIIKHILKL